MTDPTPPSPDETAISAVSGTSPVGSGPFAGLSAEAIFSTLPGIALLIHPDPTAPEILAANLVARTRFASGEVEPIGSPFSRFLPPDQPDGQASETVICDLFTKALDDGTCSAELRLSSLDSGDFPARVSISRLDSTTGPILQVIIRDLSRQDLVEGALTGSEVGYRAIIENLPDGIGVIDFTTSGEPFIIANPAAHRIFGVEEHDLIGRSFLEFVLPEDLDLIAEESRRREMGETSTYECRIRRSDGEIRSLRITSSPRRDPDGIVIGAFGFFSDISTQELTLQALEHTEERIRNILVTAQDSIITIDPSGVIDFANAAAETLALDEFGTLIDRDIRELFPNLSPGPIHDALERLVEASRQGDRIALEFEMTRNDGTRIPVQVSVSPWELGSGIHHSFFMHDLSYQKALASTLEQRSAELSTLATAISQSISIVFILDERSRFTYTNSSFSVLTGYRAEDVAGKTPWLLFPGEELEDLQDGSGQAEVEHEAETEGPPTSEPDTRVGKGGVYQGIWDTIRGGHKWRGEFPVTSKAGAVYWLAGTISPIRDDAESITGYLAVLEDRTAAWESAEALRESEERYRKVIELSPDGIVIHAEGVIRFCNHAGLRMLGLSSMDEIVGHPVRDIVANEFREIAMQRTAEILTTGAIAESIEAVFLRRDGSTFPVEVQGALIRLQEKDSVMVVFRDITVRLAADREREELLVQMGERIKEQHCMYGISRVLRKARSPEEAFSGVIGLIPEGWFHPEITVARISFDDHITADPRFQETSWMMTASIKVGGVELGKLEVAYLEECETLGEGPFLLEERDLLEGIAINLGEAIERYNVEIALAKSEELFRTIVTNSQPMIFMIDAEYRVLLSEGRMLASLGLAPGQSVGQDATEIYKDHPMILAAMDRAFAGEHVVEVLDLGDVILDTFFTPIRDDRGKVISVTGMAMDITAQMRLQDELRVSEERYRGLVETSQDLIWQVDKEGNFSYLNPAWTAILGYQIDEMIGQPFISFKRPEFVEKDLETYENIKSGTRVQGYLTTYLTKDGDDVHLLFNGMQVKDRDGAVIGTQGTAHDVTSILAAEERIRALNVTLEERVLERTAELELANRELQSFSYSVSHDLRAPLRSIEGFSQILAEDHAGILGDDGAALLTRIRAASQRMALLIDDLLRLSRITRMDLELVPVDLTALATEVFAHVSTTAPGRRVAFSVEPDLEVKADLTLMRAVLDNLIGNAFKFTREVSDARIHMSRISGSEPHVYLIEDNGIGFDPAYTDKLFTAFQRLHDSEDYPGTGIGLAIVDRAMTRQGGRVWAEGTPGSGARFVFCMGASDDG